MPAMEIPLSAAQPQSLTIALAGVVYNITLKWCNAPLGGGWVIDIADANDNPIINGIMMVTGLDLLAPYPQYNFGGQLIAKEHNPLLPGPAYADLGSDGRLFFVTVP